MAAMRTATRPRRLQDLRGPETAEQRRGRQLKVQALTTTGALLGLFNEHREQTKVSKTELADHMDTERTVVSRLLSESGDANPTIETIIKLLWGLGLRAEINVFDRHPGEGRLLQVNDERKRATAS